MPGPRTVDSQVSTLPSIVQNARMSWFVYGAMLAGLMPVIFMGIGYFYVCLKERRGERRGPGTNPPA